MLLSGQEPKMEVSILLFICLDVFRQDLHQSTSWWVVAARGFPSVLTQDRGAAASWQVVEFHRADSPQTSLRAGTSSPVRASPVYGQWPDKCHPNWRRLTVEHLLVIVSLARPSSMGFVESLAFGWGAG